ncbi:MAG: acyltransferase family protein, partial [Chloroflexaceae bacterium]|nr:acyltransferase family protein [Chloroflexaceae bacterium]
MSLNEDTPRREQQPNWPQELCAAYSRNGAPCRNRSLPGSSYCYVHRNYRSTAAPPAASAPDNGEQEEAEPVAEAPEAIPYIFTNGVSDGAAAAGQRPDEWYLAVRGPSSSTAAPITEPLAIVPVYDTAPTVTAGPPADLPPGEQLVELLRAALATLDERLPPPRPLEALPLLSRAVIPLKDYAQPELWQEAGALLHELLRGPLDFLLRRLEGNYITDAYGTDPEIIELFRPLLEFMYYRWWRVTTEGLDYVPAQGRALLVSNHSGVLPWDGAMIAASLYLHHSPRLVRNLFLDWFSKIPVLAPGFTALGQLSGLHRNATHLLEAEELLCTFPEGVKGIGKPFKDRYRLARFGRGGYVQIALRTGTPIIPVAVFGAEEIYPLMGSIDPLARLLGMPYFPVTPS